MKRNSRNSRGMVTFELAIGILSAAIVAIILSWGVSMLLLKVHCSDVAAQVARHVARDDFTQAAAAAKRAPEGAQVSIDTSTGTVMVRVVATSSLGSLGPVTLEGHAAIVKEPR